MNNKSNIMLNDEKLTDWIMHLESHDPDGAWNNEDDEIYKRILENEKIAYKVKQFETEKGDDPFVVIDALNNKINQLMKERDEYKAYKQH